MPSGSSMVIKIGAFKSWRSAFTFNSALNSICEFAGSFVGFCCVISKETNPSSAPDAVSTPFAVTEPSDNVLSASTSSGASITTSKLKLCAFLYSSSNFSIVSSEISFQSSGPISVISSAALSILVTS